MPASAPRLHRPGGVVESPHITKSSDATPPLSLTSRPKSASVLASTTTRTATTAIARRVWNAPPPSLFNHGSTPPAAGAVKATPRKRAVTGSITARDESTKEAERRTTASTLTPRTLPVRADTAGHGRVSVNAISPNRNRRLATGVTGAGADASVNTSLPPADNRSKSSVVLSPSGVKRVSVLMEELRANSNDNSNNNNKAVIPKLPPQSTYPRFAIHAPASTAVAPYVVDAPNERNKKHLTGLANDLDSTHARREELKHAFVRKTMKRQDVDGDDIRPLIEIAYWSPFLEVRRDAAAALASLSRNTANLEILSEVGALGALISMLSSYQDRLDASIARDCAQALASMVRLPSVKTKILQAPDGMDCIFSMLHATDLKLRRIACEIIMNLVTIDELREVVAKREGFAFMLTSCTSKDSRIRCLAAAILHQLAACRDNRFLFYHSTTHFETLASILCDPYMEKDFRFRRELLSFVHLLVSEEENGRRFVELNLVSTLLLFLASPKTNLQICLLVVSIIEALALYKRNHVALVAANALPRIVQFCFSANRGLPSGLGSHKPNGFLPEHRPSSAAASRRSAISQSGPGLQASAGMIAGMAASFIPRPHSSCPLPVPSEMSAILRPAFVVFCEMAKNPTNREHVIRSKLVDYIASKNLYASPDKRLRRSVITLLTFLICKERERDRQREQQQTNSVLIHSDTVKLELDEQPKTAAEKKQERDTTEEAEYKHYIELLARGVVKCLFGILHGNDFSMKVDAIGAIAQLTEDENSRITMCKPQLLQALKEFAFHPLVQTRYNIARTIANFAERPENILKLVDEGVLAILVKYVCPVSRNNEVLYEATRAIAAMSMVHASRNKLVECGVLGTLIQFCKASNTSTRVREHALTAIRNLRHDAAALRIQSIYRGWAVRAQFARNIFNRRKRLRKMTSLRKLQADSSLVTVMERLVTS